MPALIDLLQMDGAGIAAARRDATRFDGYTVVGGALPPPGILDGAAAALHDGAPLRWFGPFLFVDPLLGRIVGSGIFNGEPDDGWVEIGYGVAEGVRRTGFATAAVRALVALAFRRPGIRTVYAETAIANVPSQRVVQKAGFTWAGERFSKDDGMVDCWTVEAKACASGVRAGVTDRTTTLRPSP